MIRNYDELFLHALDCAKQLDMIDNGDTVVITAGLPLESGAPTNTLRVQVVSEDACEKVCREELSEPEQQG